MNAKLNEYLNYKQSKSFSELLFSYIDKSDKKDSEIYKKVDIDRKHFSKIRCNNNYIRRRNIIIKLCVALELERDGYNNLLNSAGYSLSKSKFDRILSFCIDNKIYDMNQINDYLYTFCNTSL